MKVLMVNRFAAGGANRFIGTVFELVAENNSLVVLPDYNFQTPRGEVPFSPTFVLSGRC